jgi:hypothetical protein
MDGEIQKFTRLSNPAFLNFFFFFLDRAVPPVNIHFASNNNIQNIKKNG